MKLEPYDRYIRRADLNYYIDIKYFNKGIYEDKYNEIKKLKNSLTTEEKEKYLNFKINFLVEEVENLHQYRFVNENKFKSIKYKILIVYITTFLLIILILI